MRVWATGPKVRREQWGKGAKRREAKRGAKRPLNQACVAKRPGEKAKK